MLNPVQASDKWSRNLAASTRAIEEGTNAVTVSPMEKAARQADQYVQGVQAAVASGKWQLGLRRRSLQDWKDAVIKKGIPRIALGASQAKPKMEAFLSEFFPHLEQGVRQLESMPRGDLQTNIARMVQMVQHNAGFKRRG